MLWPVTLAAKNRIAAPMPEPATRKLHGDISRRANAAAIQFNPHANASSTTSNLRSRARPFSNADLTLCVEIPAGLRLGARYSALGCLAR